MVVTLADEDAPSRQGFRTVLRCRWVPDTERGGLRARWEEALELIALPPQRQV